MPETKTKTSSLLDRLPELKKGKMPPVDPKLAAGLARNLMEGGKGAIVALIDELREVDDGSDWKARFMLFTLVTSAGAPGRDRQRRMLSEVLLAETAGDRPASVKTFLVSQVRLIAGGDAIPKLLPLLASDHPPVSDAATAVLVSIGAPSK